jgi:amidohydrolase
MFMPTLVSIAQKYFERIKTLRHDIHEEPELGFEEFKTAEKVKAFLDSINVSYVDHVATTGVVATIKGKYPGKTILLRADMDALAMDEDPNHILKSKVKGKMHACGHDGHTAGLCLAAALLNEHKDQLHGEVRLMFQPAEETLGGAKPMIEAGVTQGVDMAFGAHLWGSLKENHIQVKVGAMMAAPDAFKIIVKGRGGHGAMPHMCIDPIVIASSIVVSAQSIVSRTLNPLDQAVLTFGQIHGGSAFNVIPNEVTLIGTIRTFSPAVRDLIPAKLHALAKGIAQAHGGDVEFIYEPKYPVLINDENAVHHSANSFKKIVGEDNVHYLEEPNMGGEDFAYISQVVPSSFIYVGIKKEKDIIHHHPSFEWDDQNMIPLGCGLAQCALDALKE